MGPLSALTFALLMMLGQAAPPTPPLQPLDFLVGKWTGTSIGDPGEGTVEREYSFIIGGKFLQCRNRSVYPVQPKNPKGETHEDIGIFSFDRAKKQLVLRQFHTETFVNQYRADPSSSADHLVFVTDAIENIPAGFRARESYRRIGPDEFEEVFEIAEPGKDFAVYSRSRLKRVK